MKIIYLICISFFLVMGNNKKIACSCIDVDVNTAFKNADLVVTGMTLKKEKEFLPDSSKIRYLIESGKMNDELKKLAGRYADKVQFKVNTIFKGEDVCDTLMIYSALSNVSCGFSFEENESYIVYGYKKCVFSDLMITEEIVLPEGPRIYWTDQCSRTKLFDEKEIKQILGIR
jgi:hypothetical protein